jgi:putative serine protease PepD
VAALVGGIAGVGGSAAYDRYVAPELGVINSLEEPSNSDDAPAGATEQVAARLLPSVVEVGFKAGDSAGRGTGIIISSNGQILTNNHVVERVAKEGTLSVTFHDGSKVKARILGRDPYTDTAVIKAEGRSGLTPAVLGDSKDARIGQPVIVLGSPFGLSGSVTSGIISAVNRPQAFADSEGQLESSFPAIQTDAAFNVGNSGGPLADLQGRVIGISTVILSSGGGFDGVGFAIPINVAKNSARYLAKGEPAQHARIGISLAPVSGEPSDETPAEVKEVTSGSAGDKAGLRKGDLITKVDDIRITSNVGVIAAIRGYRPGDTVTVTYERGGKTRDTKVTLDSDNAEGAPKD